MNNQKISFGAAPVMKLFDLDRHYLRRELSNFSKDELTHEDVSRCVFRRRQFEIIRKSENSFLPYECIPTGGYTVDLSSEQSWSVRFDKRVELFGSYFENPESFSQACALMGLSRSSVVFSDPEFPYGSIQYSTFEEALSVVFTAVEQNEVLVAWRTENDPDEQSADMPLLAPHEHLLAEIGRWKHAMESEPNHNALFYQTELFNSPIPSTKARIMDYLNEPTLQKWESIRYLPVFKNRRVWEVLFLYDPSTLTRSAAFEESNVPSTDTLSKALSNVVRLHNEDCQRRIDAMIAKLENSGYGMGVSVDRASSIN
jgi:hypothetical protein